MNSKQKSSLRCTLAALLSLPFFHSCTRQLRTEELLPTPDFKRLLQTYVEYHQERDRENTDAHLDDRFEKQYHVRIIGLPSERDIDELRQFYEDNPERIFMTEPIPLEEIVIFPRFLRPYATFTARALIFTGKVYLFSGLILKDETAHHEWTHFGIQYLDQQGSDFSPRWKEIAGEYDKVDAQRDKQEVLQLKYKDGHTSCGPHLGYMRCYGGTDLHEDVATFVEYIVGLPRQFRQIKDSHSIYRAKVDLLFEKKFITEDEWKTVKRYISNKD